MKALYIVFVLAILAASGCSTLQPRTPVVYAQSAAPMVAPERSVWAPDPNAILKYGYPKEWKRENPVRPAAWPYCQSPEFERLREWALSASPYESDRVPCKGGGSTCTCKSKRGPSGRSKRRFEKELEGGSEVIFRGEQFIARNMCANAPSEQREVKVTLDRFDKPTVRLKNRCYYW
jgi:hypothetical protein